MKRIQGLACLLLIFHAAVVFADEQISREPRGYRALLVFLQGVDVSAAKNAFQLAQQQLERQTGERLSIAHDIFLNIPEFQGTPMRRIALLKHFLRSELKRGYDLVYVTLPAELERHPDQKYLLGFSEAIGSLGRFSNVMAYSIVSGDQLYDSKLILHELAHLLGATHSQTGLMQGDFNVNILNAELSQESLCQISQRRKVGSASFQSSAFQSALQSNR